MNKNLRELRELKLSLQSSIDKVNARLASTNKIAGVGEDEIIKEELGNIYRVLHPMLNRMIEMIKESDTLEKRKYDIFEDHPVSAEYRDHYKEIRKVNAAILPLLEKYEFLIDFNY